MESSATTETEQRRLRSDTRGLPRTAEELVALFKRVVELPGIQKIEVTPAQVLVQRLVADGESVIPEPEEENESLDPAFILSLIEKNGGLVALEFDPARHPYISLLEATSKISAQKLRPTFIVVSPGGWLGAFLGLPEGEFEPDTCFGMKVIYTANEIFEEKLLVLGGPSNLLTDVSYGVVIDMGG
jgi:hypothetical protein